MFGGASGLLATMLVAPAVLAVIVGGVGNRYVGVTARAGAVIAGLGFVAACILMVDAGSGTPASATVAGFPVVADRLAALLLLLVFGVSCVVQSFAVRYLTGDPRAAWFTAGASLLTAASAGLVTAATVIGLALCWTLAGAALCLLLAMYWHLPAARDGVRRTVTAFVVGDLALWIAVAMITVRWGAVDLRALNGDRSGEPLLPLLGTLIVVAALSRSAQLPFHRWLPATLAAPTPVSALLHAGVVNAGGILLVRLAPLVTGDLARALMIAAGAATMLYGAVIMLVKPDVKGALVNSTMAQMGFMIVTCGLGLWIATIFHLVAHGFYKSALFLSSGSAIARHRRAAAYPRPQRTGRGQKALIVIAAAILPATALYAAVHVISLGAGDHAAERALLIFAWFTGFAATSGWLARRRGMTAVVTAAAVLVSVAAAYVGLLAALGAYLEPALPADPPPATLAWTVTAGMAIVLTVLLMLRLMPGNGMYRALYANAITAGHIPPPVLTQPTGAPS